MLIPLDSQLYAERDESKIPDYKWHSARRLDFSFDAGQSQEPFAGATFAEWLVVENRFRFVWLDQHVSDA